MGELAGNGSEFTHGANSRLLLAFDTDDPEFVRGVEVGMIWARLNNEPGVVEATVHGSNAEMMARISDTLHRKLMTKDEGDWMYVTFGPAGTS